MNLSERLDAARRRREQGAAPEPDGTGYTLRARIEGQGYDGRDVRTGEAMTAERWERRRQELGLHALPHLADQDQEAAEAPTDHTELLSLDLTGEDPVIEHRPAGEDPGAP